MLPLLARYFGLCIKKALPAMAKLFLWNFYKMQCFFVNKSAPKRGSPIRRYSSRHTLLLQTFCTTLIKTFALSAC